MLRIVLTAPANLDLMEIFDYIAADNFDAARSTHKKFLDCFEMLASSPKGGRNRDELKNGLRSFSKDRYVIFYRIIDNGIEILRVLHSSRDIENILDSAS